MSTGLRADDQFAFAFWKHAAFQRGFCAGLWQILHCSSDDCEVVACKLAGSIRSRYSCCEGSCCAMQFVLLFCGVNGLATAVGTILGGVAMNGGS